MYLTLLITSCRWLAHTLPKLQGRSGGGEAGVLLDQVLRRMLRPGALARQPLRFSDGAGGRVAPRFIAPHWSSVVPFALNNALLDAGIAAWDAKRHYDYVRPITAIRFLFAGEPVAAWCGPYGGTCLIDGRDWMPYQPLTFVTPPFAEYVSGHSTFSAAAAEILMLFTGSDAFNGSVTLPAGSSRVERGTVPAVPITLAWATFSDAADLSRRYGGIHFADGDLQGRQMGRRVGAQTWRKALSYFDGAAVP